MDGFRCRPGVKPLLKRNTLYVFNLSNSKYMFLRPVLSTQEIKRNLALVLAQTPGRQREGATIAAALLLVRPEDEQLQSVVRDNDKPEDMGHGDGSNPANPKDMEHGDGSNPANPKDMEHGDGSNPANPKDMGHCDDSNSANDK